jgi:hypothetical protein
MSANPGKASIMQNRKIQLVAVEAPFVSHREIIYNAVRDNGGIKRDALKQLVEKMGVLSQTVNYTLRDLLEANYLMYTRGSKGAGDDDQNKTHWRWFVTDKEYVPQRSMRKVAPNDKKAMKSIEKMTTSKYTPETVIQEEAVQKLAMVQGMTNIDASDPHFAEAARSIIEKVTPPLSALKNEVLAINADHAKPITTMWFEVGTQTLMTTPQQAYQLYRELEQIFDRK